ncbi:MAG: tRNA (adenosine(37)-N6)-threonylcarbamoyltransferase complex ATPase subunit type 1 TsaE [Candidatus Buchananbacteria bacterium CG10_big_fil_rev_8_21_14_0_10_42_9]|uniref:tRNA threonylcarbamoyladenosine biosynthesis protein TsaE n=1 Tax=Candidatus Buchananbacteria bacterium CG10_big_fil_rev_8_21_14_0_10_42_9 TaxID=1974526 RepID=A0A2H0W3G0_9BACT|nr:MAG: tRNA (adenosine(37)-N6)-threonylcarbamoyltransferase complex ATPase subunit type 1 TsaE [Candidatus Buchananbacteria bacterium CG10_big_fil_rev_8_21_14_0_10_42_9]
MKKFISNSPKDTKRFGHNLVNKLRPGTAVALSGDLGAGKTTLVQGVAEALGIKNQITSPTFTLMDIYPVRSKDSNGVNSAKSSIFETLVHIDCYRLDSPKEFGEFGAMDYINDPKSLVIVEWANKIKQHLPKDAVWLNLKLGQSERQRVITLTGSL